MDDSSPQPPIAVAIDAGPLYGHRTGVGIAAAGFIDELHQRSEVDLNPYLVSFRATPQPGHMRLPLPGIVASHAWSRSAVPRADRWLVGVDVVHGTNYVAPPTRLPTVISVYDCWFLVNSERSAPVIKRAGRTLRRAVADGAWLHVSASAINDETRAVLGTDRVRTIPLGPPPPVAPLSELAVPAVASAIVGRPFILAIGTEEVRKDLPLLIEAFAAVASEVPDVLLVLAGAPGSASTAVDAAVGTLPVAIRSRVHRLGRVDEPAKHWLLRQASVLAYLSLDEGFGFPILEAHEAGTPVVARAVGSVPEVAGDAALLVAERDAHAVADALRRCLTDGGLRLTLIGGGHSNRARFSWEATADQMIDLYRTAISEH
ncbi:MAG TPA: glycosyltransferase family 1 protein [Ilumatobacter sp.]|nr:glycosyltransferase family 1 protein [Ilumatobacter sp.]